MRARPSRAIAMYCYRLVCSMSRSYKNNFIDSEGGGHLEFCSKIFASWDLAVTQKDACSLQKELIRNQLKVLNHT